MQIQLIGSTSAGKSTLARRILEAYREEGIDALMGDELVLRQARLGWVNAGLARTLGVDLLSILACLMTWRQNRDFFLFTVHTVFRLPRTITWRAKLNIVRNVLKKVGIFEIIERRGSEGQIVLVDEGTVHAAHNLFVHVAAQTDANGLSAFARLVPLPDVVIYVRQSDSVLIARTIKRGHKRIPDRSHAQTEVFVKRAVDTFDSLVQQLVLEKRVISVDNQQNIILVQEHQRDPLLAVALKIIRADVKAVTENNRTGMQPDHGSCRTGQQQVYYGGE